jgi:hypothetical protein
MMAAALGFDVYTGMLTMMALSPALFHALYSAPNLILYSTNRFTTDRS